MTDEIGKGFVFSINRIPINANTRMLVKFTAVSGSNKSIQSENCYYHDIFSDIENVLNVDFKGKYSIGPDIPFAEPAHVLIEFDDAAICAQFIFQFASGISVPKRKLEINWTFEREDEAITFYNEF